MSKLWRTVFAWMLVIALPLQGYVAHAMTNCGPAHHGARQLQELAAQSHASKGLTQAGLHSAHAEHAGHAGHADPVEQHRHGAAAAAPDTDATEHTNASAATVDGGKCSVCASCCSAAAIAVSAFALDLVPQQVLFVPTIPAGHDHAACGGLDRPPQAA
jgi:hypothetical protein